MSTDIKFEKALEQLEKIVEDLESGNLSLDDALKKYEEGVKLARLCTQKLQQAENKIEILTQALNTKVEVDSLEAEGTSEETKKSKKSSKKASTETENDLLL